MAKIKVKDLEGDAEEIKNLLKDFGCDLNTYINTQPITKKIPDFWLYILVPIFFILSPGADPVKEVEKLARLNKIEPGKSFWNISLG